MATMLLWLGLTMCETACLLPQDDDLILTGELPKPANRPLRILQEQPQPPQRETTVRLAANCGSSRSVFSVRVEDPDEGPISNRWFIDPDENYLGGVEGNPPIPLQGSPTKRVATAPSTFTNVLAGMVDGRKHRVEVVVTDGLFTEVQRDMASSYLDIVPRNAIADAGTQVVYRDEWVWLVEVLSCP